MSAINKLRIALNQPYPGSENIKDELKGIIIAGLLVSAVLFVFRPFGLASQANSVIFQTSLLFGAVTFVIHVRSFIQRILGDLTLDRSRSIRYYS